MNPIRDRLVPEPIQNLKAYFPPAGGGSVRLDANESPFVLPDPINLKIKTALDRLYLNRYPDPSSASLRKSFASRFGCVPDQVLVGNGSDELIATLLWTFRGHGEGKTPCVLLPVPTFGMYAIGAAAAGYQVVRVPLRPDLTPDLEAMTLKIREVDPNLVFLSSPNNPTGGLFSAGEIEAVLDAARGIVVVDEAYADFSQEPTWCSRVDAYPNLVVLRTLSKVGGAALRCGFLVGSPDLLKEMNKVRQPFNVSSFTQAAGEIMLENFDLLMDRVLITVAQRDHLGATLNEWGYKVHPSRANFFLMQAGGREGELSTFLHQAGIVVRFLSRLEVIGDALRITVGEARENMVLLERIRSFSL